MANAFRNKHFVAGLYGDLFSADGEFESPFHHGHQLIRRVDEIIPFTSGGIGKHIAGVTAPAPIVRDLVTVERHGEFLRGEIRHGANVIVSGLDIQQMSTESMRVPEAGSPIHFFSITYSSR